MHKPRPKPMATDEKHHREASAILRMLLRSEVLGQFGGARSYGRVERWEQRDFRLARERSKCRAT